MYICIDSPAAYICAYLPNHYSNQPDTRSLKFDFRPGGAHKTNQKSIKHHANFHFPPFLPHPHSACTLSTSQPVPTTSAPAELGQNSPASRRCSAGFLAVTCRTNCNDIARHCWHLSSTAMSLEGWGSETEKGKEKESKRGLMLGRWLH